MHHPREGERLGESGGGQLNVLVGEHLQHSLVLVIGVHLDGTVVIAVKDLPVWEEEGDNMPVLDRSAAGRLQVGRCPFVYRCA